ncbi:MAG: outer membrane beta-barrel protein [Ignavibacteria bacterium]|nr:outer membrane beta-barrel protein [Ignavibacteria bacterium]
MKKIVFFVLISVLTLTVNAQIKFGPVVNLGLGFYSNRVDDLTLRSSVNPSFGFAIEKYIDYWFSLRTSALYSFRNLSAKQKSDGLTDRLNGQFVDLFVDGIFSDFDDTNKISPYGTTGLGVGFNIINKGQEKFLLNNEYENVLPFFTVGAGIRYKISFLSALDISLNYNRCLRQPINYLDARLNQLSLKVITLF